MARIAVVDSDPRERASIAKALFARGHEPLEWPCARTALDELVPRAPDVLIVALSDASGLDLVARLRSCHARPFPVVLVSADPEDARRGGVLGVSEHVLSPVDVDRTVSVVERLLAAQPLEHDLPVDRQGLVFGRYTLKRVLGEGSSGAVYEGWDERRGGPVALKVLGGAVEDIDGLARFVREARVLSRVQDPHVVPMLDAGVMDGRAFCAMRLIKGPTLAEHLWTKGPLSEEEALALLTGLLRALDALARRQLVHRDVTPKNVVLEGGRPARPVIIDFGLAKRLQDQALTGADVLLGTAGYIAPEVVNGAEADTRSDMFAAGVVTVQALLGRHPVDGLRSMALIEAMAEAPVVLPAHLSPGLRALLSRLTALEPDRRPRSPAEALAMTAGLSRAGAGPSAYERDAETRRLPRMGHLDR